MTNGNEPSDMRANDRPHVTGPVSDDSDFDVPQISSHEDTFKPGRIGAERILRGPIRSAVFWLALPILGEQMLNACVTWYDAFLAGHISAEATGAVGFAGYVGWLMTMLFWLVGVGATAIISRAVGSKDLSEARRTTNQAFVMAIVLGLLGSVFVYVAAPGFAALLNMQGAAATIAIDYMRIDALGMIGASISFVLAACLRGAGDTRTPLIILGGVNVFNLIVSRLLTFGIGPFEGVGVNGIAIGTAGARWMGGLWILWLMRRQSHGLRLNVGLMRPDRELIGRMLRIGLPAAVDGMITFAGHFIFMTIVSRVPMPPSIPVAALYAAHIVGVRIESLSYLPANAYYYAASTLVGQNLGARQPVRARRVAHEAVLQAFVILIGSGLLYFFGAEWLYRLLSKDPNVWACGVPALTAMAFFQLAMAPLIVYLGALRGAGDTRVPMYYTIFGMALVRLPVAFFGGFVLKWGLLGAWLGMFADLTIRAALVGWRFQSGRWERIMV